MTRRYSTLTLLLVAVLAAGACDGLVAPDHEVLTLRGNAPLEGVQEADVIVIPPGVTVNASGALMLLARDSLEIAGTLLVDCAPLTLYSTGRVRITGTVRNSCAALPETAPPGLVIAGEEGFHLEGVDISSSGDVTITTDTTVTLEADTMAVDTAAQTVMAGGFAPALSSATPSFATAADDETTAICYIGGTIEARGGARSGTKGGAVGGPGERGGSIHVICDRAGRDLIFEGATLRAQAGGWGGDASHESATNAVAIGGQGGRGGHVLILSGRNITFRSSNRFESGNGGKGGSGEATGLTGRANGGYAARASSFGGGGGEPGMIRIQRRRTIIVQGALEFHVGEGGKGGDAATISADGLDATDTDPAQHGGESRVEAGKGGNSLPRNLSVGGALDVREGANVTFTGGGGGDGGIATLTVGSGGDGSAKFRNGGDGGEVAYLVEGGGGHARVQDAAGQLFGPGGDGGLSSLRGGTGGAGWDGCEQKPSSWGGNGGKGAVFRGWAEGVGGDGKSYGATPDGEMSGYGNGGDGGLGNPVGFGGDAGAGPPELTRNGRNLEPGEDGKPCPGDDFGTVIQEGELQVVQDATPSAHDPYVFSAGTGKQVTVKVAQEDQLITVAGTAGFSPSELPLLYGDLLSDNTFSASGSGLIADTPDVLVTAAGSVTSSGQLVVEFTVGGDGKLPGGQAVTYRFEGQE